MDEEQKRLMEELFGGEQKPSFAKMLYFGAFDAQRVFPYPQLSEQEKSENDAFIGKLNAFADKHLDPDWIDRHAEIPEPVIRGLGEMGLLGMTIPEEYGGLGVSQYAYCRAEEELARRCASTALFVNAHQSIGLKSLLLFGTDEQRKQWLPGLAKGELLAAFSLTEPNAGSDAGGVETRAVYDPENDTYVINGKKQWTTNGSIADILVVMARTELDTPKGKQDKITAFLVTPDMPGFKVRDPALEKVGMRGTKTSNLSFDNLVVPAKNILGPVGKGLRVALTLLDFGRTTFGATCTGTAKYLYERAVEHARSRHQFKRPLASFGLVKAKLARIAALVYAMDATTYLTAGLIDTDEEDIMIESAMLKVFASDAQWSILYDTMQIFGGRSFFTDEPFERMMRDSRLNLIGEGSNEVMRAFIGAVGMRDVGMQLKDSFDAIKAPSTLFTGLRRLSKQLLQRLKTPKIPVQSPLLRDEARALAKSVRRFGMAVIKTLGKHGEDIVDRQLELDRIATAGMALYTATAVLGKVDRDLAAVNGNAAALGNDVAVAKHYLQMAQDTITCSLSSLGYERDAAIESVSDLVCGLDSRKQYT